MRLPVYVYSGASCCHLPPRYGDLDRLRLADHLVVLAISLSGCVIYHCSFQGFVWTIVCTHIFFMTSIAYDIHRVY